MDFNFQTSESEACRADSELVLDNIFRIFDPDETGSVRFNELLMAFSMSMRGSGEQADPTMD